MAVAASVFVYMHSQDRRCGRGSCEGLGRVKFRRHHEGMAVGTGPVHRKSVGRTR